MTFRAFLRTLREGYLVVVVSLVAAVGVAVIVLSTQPTSYRTSSFVHVDVALPAQATAEDFEAAVEYANYRTITYEALIEMDVVLDPVIDELGLDVSARELGEHVAPISALDTNIIEIRVTWPDREESARIADSVAEQISAEGSEVGDELAVEVTVARRADAAAATAVPSALATVALAIFGGLLLSSAWLVARTARRERLRASAE